MPQIPDALRRSQDLPRPFVEVVTGLESLALACMDLYHESATARAAWHRASIAEDEAKAATKAVAPFRIRVASAVGKAYCQAEGTLAGLYAERTCAYLIASASVLSAAAEGRSPDLQSLTDLVDREVVISEVRAAVQMIRNIAALDRMARTPLKAMDFDTPAAFAAELEGTEVYGQQRHSPTADPPITLYMDELVLELERFRVFRNLAESAHYAIAQVLVPDLMAGLGDSGADGPVVFPGENYG